MSERNFSLPVRVYYEDTDSAGVVYYANYLRFLERARTEWLRELGFDHTSLRARHSVAFVVARLELDYLRPARLDDRLEVSVVLAKPGGASFVLDQSVTRGADELLCRGRVRVGCIDTGHLGPCRIPQDVITELKREHRSVTH